MDLFVIVCNENEKMLELGKVWRGEKNLVEKKEKIMIINKNNI